MHSNPLAKEEQKLPSAWRIKDNRLQVKGIFSNGRHIKEVVVDNLIALHFKSCQQVVYRQGIFRIDRDGIETVVYNFSHYPLQKLGIRGT